MARGGLVHIGDIDMTLTKSALLASVGFLAFAAAGQAVEEVP